MRRKLAEWLKKKKKVDEEKERKRTLKIEELLDAMGITYEEATRAAGLIQVPTSRFSPANRFDIQLLGELFRFRARNFRPDFVLFFCPVT